MDLLILVTLGTQFEPFHRLLKEIEKLDLSEEVIVQAGHTKFESSKMKILDFIPYEEMNSLVDKARIIITHGGTGSIVEPLKKGKVIIGCARLEKYGEHVDDHQTELVSIFSDEGYILELKDGESLKDILKQAETFVPKKYESNTDSFIAKLQARIDNYLGDDELHMNFKETVLNESKTNLPKLLICTPRISVGGMERAYINMLNMSNITKNYEVWAYVGYVKDKEYLKNIPENVHLHVVCKDKWVTKNKIKAVLSMLKDSFTMPKFDKAICFGHNNMFMSLLTRRASKDNVIFIHADLDSRTDKELKQMKRTLKFESFKKVVCVSNKAADSFKKHFKHKDVLVINNYIDGEKILREADEQFEDARSMTDTLSFVNICRQEEKSKKLTRVIYAVDRLVKEGFNFKLYLIGEGPDTAMYKDLVDKLSLDKHIVFLGQKTNPYPYIKNSSALVFCSIFEGYGIVLDEARVLNTPFISTDVADAKSIACEGYGIVCANSEDGIYNGMKQFIKEGYNIKIPFDYTKFNDKITESIDKMLEV